MNFVLIVFWPNTKQTVAQIHQKDEMSSNLLFAISFPLPRLGRDAASQDRRHRGRPVAHDVFRQSA